MSGAPYGRPRASLAPLAAALESEVKRAGRPFDLVRLEQWAKPLLARLVELGFIGKNDPCYVEYGGTLEFGSVHVHVTGGYRSTGFDPAAERWIVVARDGTVSVT